MCGIVAYLGEKNAYEVVIKGLQRLEYRGYDSSGVAIHNDNSVNVYKQKGKVQDLIDFASDKDTNGSLAIGHTRWATHGLPNNINAHPHQSSNGKISLVHNGIIENYSVLKKELEQRGHKFLSETDTEVLVHLIDFSNQTKIFHVGYYKNTILETPYEYLLKDSTDDNHQFEQFFYDLTDINESNNFIRFSTMNEKGNKTTYVLNKQNNTLIFDRDLPDEWSEKISRLNMSEEWLKKNTGYGWTRTCKII